MRSVGRCASRSSPVARRRRTSRIARAVVDGVTLGAHDARGGPRTCSGLVTVPLGRLDVLAYARRDRRRAVGAGRARGPRRHRPQRRVSAPMRRMTSSSRLVSSAASGMPIRRTVHVRAGPPIPSRAASGRGEAPLRERRQGRHLVRQRGRISSRRWHGCPGRHGSSSKAYSSRKPWSAGLRPPHPRRAPTGSSARSSGSLRTVNGGPTSRSAGCAVRSSDIPPRQACELALIAAQAAGAALVGVDLVPDADGGWTVIEVNGAVEFTGEYQLAGDVFADVAGALVTRPSPEANRPRQRRQPRRRYPDARTCTAFDVAAVAPSAFPAQTRHETLRPASARPRRRELPIAPASTLVPRSQR